MKQQQQQMQHQQQQQQQKVLIGGPLLGTVNLTNAILKVPKQQQQQQQQQKVVQEVSTSQKDLLLNTNNVRTFEPIITNIIKVQSSSTSSVKVTKERLLLLPHNYYITIVSYKTGKTIGYFVLQQQQQQQKQDDDVNVNNDDDNINTNNNDNRISIMCCTIIQKQNIQQQILLVGCSNGTIQEYNVDAVLLSEISSLQKEDHQQQQQQQPHHNIVLPGPIYFPQHVYQIVVPSSSSLASLASSSSDKRNKKDKDSKNDSTLCIYHLASVLSSSSSLLTVYAYTLSYDMNDKLISSILCIYLPQVIPTTSTGTIQQQQEKTVTTTRTTTTTTIITANVVCTDSDKPIAHHNDIAFQFFAMSILPVSKHVGGRFMSSSSNNNADVSVVIIVASAKKLSIYCHNTDNNNNNNNTELSTITTTIHVPMNDYNYNNHSNVNTYDLLTAITTSNYTTTTTNSSSPNNIDITCGYQSGTIRIFVNAIQSIIQYHTDNQLYLLQQKQFKSNNNNNNSTSSILPIQKPNNPFDTKHSSNNNNSNTTNNRIIIRKLHWHAHPVLSLRYDSSSSTGNGNGLLYSGGIESVLVIWQLSHNTFKPADYLPRVSMGSIEQISVVPINNTTSSNDNYNNNDDDDVDTILLYCSDNTVQLIDSISKNCIWKIRGLATTSVPPTTSSSTSMIRHPIVHIPSSLSTSTSSSTSSGSTSMIAITCLPNAPGCIQLYNPNNQCVISSLQVVPFNRVSRTNPIYLYDGQIIDDIDTTIPYPYVSHTSWNDTNDSIDSSNNTTNVKTLVTVDVVPTENDCVGKKEKLPNGQVYGTTTTLRFWEYTTTTNKNSSTPTPESSSSSSSALLDSYQQVACMTYPHGRANTVSAIAVSPNGLYVVTVSNDEKAFRLWQRQRSIIDHEYDYNDDNNDNNNSTTDIDSDNFQQQNKKRKRLYVDGNRNNDKAEWYCRCKVSTPASLSYYTTGISAVSFSNDSTVIVIGYGTTISLWDYKSVTLITCHRHGIENIPKQIHQQQQQIQIKIPIIDTIQFITSQLLPIDVLVSKSKTTVVVQSIYGPRDDFGWIWEIVPNEIHFVHISNITYISSHNVIAIALYNTKQNNTCIVLVNATTGKLYNNPSNNNHNGSSINSSMDNENVFDNIIGEVVALAPATGNKSIITLLSQQQQPIQLYAIMDSGEMLLLTSNTNTSNTEKGNTVISHSSENLFVTNKNNYSGGVPAIPVLASIEKQRIENEKQEKYQQQVTLVTIDDIVRKRNLQQQVSSIVSISNFGSVVRTTEQQQQQQSSSSSSVQNNTNISTTTLSQILPTRDLPQLDGSFALSFLSRTIQRGNE